MPLAKYFKGKGQQVLSDMKDRYGDDKGKKVFYATANSRPGMKPQGEESGDRRAAPPATKSNPKRKTIGQRMAESGGY